MELKTVNDEAGKNVDGVSRIDRTPTVINRKFVVLTNTQVIKKHKGSSVEVEMMIQELKMKWAYMTREMDRIILKIAKEIERRNPLK